MKERSYIRGSYNNHIPDAVTIDGREYTHIRLLAERWSCRQSVVKTFCEKTGIDFLELSAYRVYCDSAAYFRIMGILGGLGGGCYVRKQNSCQWGDSKLPKTIKTHCGQEYTHIRLLAERWSCPQQVVWEFAQKTGIKHLEYNHRRRYIDAGAFTKLMGKIGGKEE